uniref:(northern house mosquito) hypothetical protein n=1 Tax=Culex pipiens TaxID=7175 RepID=A0A8D8D6Z1_CULPI
MTSSELDLVICKQGAAELEPEASKRRDRFRRRRARCRQHVTACPATQVCLTFLVLDKPLSNELNWAIHLGRMGNGISPPVSCAFKSAPCFSRYFVTSKLSKPSCRRLATS